MDNSDETIKITIHETQGCLVVPIQEELSKKAALEIQRGILEQVHRKSVKGVIIDLSGVKVIDGVLWEVFTKTTRMIKMLGPPSVITGLSPGVVASIVDLNLDINEITTAMNLEDALKVLALLAEPEAVDEDDEDNAEDVEFNNAFDKETVNKSDKENPHA